MPLIILHTEIYAPREICFDLSRSMEVHVLSMKKYNEKIIGERKSGLIQEGEEVEFEAKHLGITQTHKGKVKDVHFPFSFVDVMVQGTFKSLHHHHSFHEKNGITLMIDTFKYESPLGILGRWADHLFLEKYMKKLIEGRNTFIKKMAESNEWKNILNYEV